MESRKSEFEAGPFGGQYCHLMGPAGVGLEVMNLSSYICQGKILPLMK
jgi:hypothetical protein